MKTTARRIGLALAASALAALAPAAVPAQQQADPSIARGPWIQHVIGQRAMVRWELDRPGVSFLELLGPGEEKPRVLRCNYLDRKHRVTIDGLEPGAHYRYRLKWGADRVGPEFSFRAAAPAGKKFTFCVFGDAGRGTREQHQVAKMIAQSDAELALITGDIVYGSGEEEHYQQRFFEPYREALPRITFWPALGNHDAKTMGGAPALANFNVPWNGPPGIQPGKNYSFDYGDAHFAAIDSNQTGTNLRKIAAWLHADMERTDKPWKFVFYHHPPYSSGKHGEAIHMKAAIAPIMAEVGVTMAFAGHDHTYERTHPIDGVIHVVSGNGGNRLYERRFERDYTARFYNEKHGLTLVTIDGEALLLRHINVDGEQIDRFEMKKGGAPAPRERPPAERQPY